MSYDYDGDGNKIFYEKELLDEQTPSPDSFEKWYNDNIVELQEQFIENNQDEEWLDDDLSDIEDNGAFQSFTEEEYDKYTGEYDG